MVNPVIISAMLILFAAADDRYPVRLRNVLDPERPRSSQLEWTVTWIGGWDDGLVQRYVTRTAGDTVWESNLGDQNGDHRASFTHPGNKFSSTQFGVSVSREKIENMGLEEVPKERNSGTRNSMVYEGEVWYLNADKPVSGFLSPVGSSDARAPTNLESVGLRPSWEDDYPTNPFGLPRIHSEGLESATFVEGSEKDRVTLTAEYGSYRLTWTFDDNKGGLPVEAALYRNDLLLCYSRTESEKKGGRWHPSAVEFYMAESTSPYKRIDVQRATFDEPWHMQEITPDQIGRVYGTVFSTPDGDQVWNGFELTDSAEFWEAVYLYDMLPDRRILDVEAKLAGLPYDEFVASHRLHGERLRREYERKHGEEPWLAKKPGKEKDEWDIYVEEFLTKHKLPAPGVQRANEIRDQSKNLRDAYRRKNESKLREAKKEGDPRKIAEYEGIEKRIFDNVLVRELNKLVQDEKDSPKKEP